MSAAAVVNGTLRVNLEQVGLATRSLVLKSAR